MDRAELRVWLDTRFCGCGMPKEAAAALLRLLRLHSGNSNRRREMETWIPDAGIRYLLLYWLDAQKLTEHGFNIANAWATSNGIDLMGPLEAEEKDGFESLFAAHCGHGFDVDDSAHACV